VLDRLGSVDDLPRTLRDQVAGVRYALRLADRSQLLIVGRC
jgi:hypothetical protein